MENRGSFIAGVAAGAGIMYLLDPEGGARRRSLLRDQAVHAQHVVKDRVGPRARDLKNRSTGLVQHARARFQPDDQPSDDLLDQRVRSQLGHAVSHPGSITVLAQGGRVTLRGPVLADEAEHLIERVRNVRGVREVVDELERHAIAADVPGLQGGRRVEDGGLSPGARLLLGALGGLAVIQGARMRGVGGTALGIAGLAALTGAGSGTAGRRPWRRAPGGEIDVERSITVHAPVERVWETWSRFEQFPRFMAHVESVTDLGDGRSRWVAKGPGGAPMEWDAVITRWIPNQAISWKSTEGSAVQNAGRVRFSPVEGNRTRVEVRMTYHPPAGSLGHRVAELLGDDPGHAMDEDLNRFRELVEQDTAVAAGERPVTPGS